MKKETIGHSPQWLDRKGLAAYFGMSVSYLRQLTKEGRGPTFYRSGRRYFFNVAEAEEWMRSQHCGSLEQS